MEYKLSNYGKGWIVEWHGEDDFQFERTFVNVEDLAAWLKNDSNRQKDEEASRQHYGDME